MAERPVFVPLREGPRVVAEVPITFRWHEGMAASQKRKNVGELHQAAASRGLVHLIEVSSKSDRLIGQRLSAFHQKLQLSSGEYRLESVYQGCKVFREGGPFVDLFEAEPREAKRDPRLSSSGDLIRFELEGEHYPLSPTTAFYDWLYLRCIYPERAWLSRLARLDGFTDIEFNPARSLNCQARSCALFVALDERGRLDQAMSSFAEFVRVQAMGI